MNETPTEIFQQLVARWIEEFGRAVEMFTGEAPVLTSIGAPPQVSEAEISPLTWWKQVVLGDASFNVWVGAAETLWSALSEGPEAQSSFFEMLGQANSGMAAVFSAGFPTPLRCEDGLIEAPVLPLDVASTQVKVEFRGAEAGVLLLLVENAGLAILSPAEPAPLPAMAGPEMNASPAMLSRLMELQLPVSVLLGRANMTIKEALKLVSGSIIELDRQVGDHVEVIVHGTVVAKGEIVSVKGNYGVRIKEVISRQDRIALREAA